MALDYKAIRRDKEREYGTKVGNYGRSFAEDIYADRTHFIFELLQNAEDALLRRNGSAQGPRSVSFRLSETGLRFSHYGKPFDESDVRGICEIGESTKADDLTTIGRFGVGFKAVYAVTNRPEIHSGPEDFAVENYVLPAEASPITRNPDETVILLPFKSVDGAEYDEIAEALAKLDASTLLFLREIDEIRWEAEEDRQGTITRNSEALDDGVRRVRIAGDQVVTAQWLVFSRAVTNDKGEDGGDVEIAFSLASDGSIKPTSHSPLSVFFPTSVSTGLKFLMQGPYRTTLARDNIPWSDDWNKQLVRETALRLRESLRWIRDNDLLNVKMLCCLPIEPHQYGDPFRTNSPFTSIFDAAKESLSSEPLLPGLDGGYVSARQARLGSTKGVRELFVPSQLSALHGEEHELVWLDDAITPDQTRELWQYLTSPQGLGIQVVTPDSIVTRLRSRKDFLEAQSDNFIISLYNFFNGQRALRSDLNLVPLIRMEDNTHVQPRSDGQPNAFLPGNFATDFPTVKTSISENEAARQFLQQGLGLRESDPVDDIIRHIVPMYQRETVEVSDDDYKNHIDRILNAHDSDSQSQRSRLIDDLRSIPFVRAVDAGLGTKSMEKPDALYLATERLKNLFSGVEGVKIVDDSYGCLRGESVRTLLEACGAVRHLRTVQYNNLHSLSPQDRERLRNRSSQPKTSGQRDQVKNWKIAGLEDLLSEFSGLTCDRRPDKAKWLWEELAHLEERRGRSVFEGEYFWSYYGNYSQPFDADFVKQLNETAWVPDENGDSVRPELVRFDALGWRPHPFLQSKIQFKPPIIDSLAQEADLEPGAIDLMRKEGLTEADLKELLELRKQSNQDGEPSTDGGVAGPASGAPTPAVVGGTTVPTASGEYSSGSGTASGSGAGIATGTSSSDGRSGGSSANAGSANRPNRENGTWQFFPHVEVQHAEATDPGSSGYKDKMGIEEQAIQFILQHEPGWQRMPIGNPGYDLCQDQPDGTSIYCEVKGMSGTLNNHAADMTPTEFRAAQEYGEAYWLYVVERVGEDDIHILKIHDPAGQAHRFSFNDGWKNVADVVS